MTDFKLCTTVEEADAVLSALVQRQNGGDGNYFKSQRNRFRYSVSRINELCPRPVRILDIGSHYLHQAALLSLLGHDVYGLDVPLFTDPPFIRERAQAMKITNISSTGHQAGEFAQGQEGTFDLVVCTEMLEHIAFNPVAFWHRVWELLAKDGVIYVTTPNSFRLRALVKTLIRLVSFEGVGLSVHEVLTVITYGHHWKEYSAREIHKYFEQLSPDFTVETRTYPESDAGDSLLSRALEWAPPFRTNIEAVIRLKGKTTFLESPVLPMMAKK